MSAAWQSDPEKLALLRASGFDLGPDGAVICAKCKRVAAWAETTKAGETGTVVCQSGCMHLPGPAGVGLPRLFS